MRRLELSLGSLHTGMMEHGLRPPRKSPYNFHRFTRSWIEIKSPRSGPTYMYTMRSCINDRLCRPHNRSVIRLGRYNIFLMFNLFLETMLTRPTVPQSRRLQQISDHAYDPRSIHGEAYSVDLEGRLFSKGHGDQRRIIRVL